MDAKRLECLRDALLKHLDGVRALNMKPLQVSKATITYGELATLAGIGHPLSVSPYLNVIAAGGERLDCLVVNKRTGRPSAEKFQGPAWELEVQHLVSLVAP